MPISFTIGPVRVEGDHYDDVVFPVVMEPEGEAEAKMVAQDHALEEALRTFYGCIACAARLKYDPVEGVEVMHWRSHPNTVEVSCGAADDEAIGANYIGSGTTVPNTMHCKNLIFKATMPAVEPK